MNKEEFVQLLNEQDVSKEYRSCFVRMYQNSDDFWQWYEPCVDGLQPEVDLSKDSVVIYTCDQCLYDNDSAKKSEFTYEEFREKFIKKVVYIKTNKLNNDKK